MRPVLITIPISHYCEKARWALERAGIEYDEEPHPPLLHLAFTLGGETRSTPQLRLAERTISQSREIVRYADSVKPSLFPEDPAKRADLEAFESRCDDAFGPAVRRYAYHHLLDRMDLLLPMFLHGVRPHERLLFHALRPIVPSAMRKAMRIDARTAERSLGVMLRFIDEVDERLRDGRPFLGGDTFTFADLTFAALGAPLVAPKEHPLRMPSTDVAPAALARELERVRARPACQLIERLYATERSRA